MDQARATAIRAFLRAAEPLKATHRSGRTSDGGAESVAAHTWRLCLLALLVEDAVPDPLHLLRLLIVHDLGEAISGDVPAIHQTDGDGREARERADLLTLSTVLPADLKDRIVALWDEYAAGATPTARLAKGLDKIETMAQHLDGAQGPEFDYAWNLGYGRRWTDAQAVTRALRAVVDAQTQARAAAGGATAPAGGDAAGKPAPIRSDGEMRAAPLPAVGTAPAGGAAPPRAEARPDGRAVSTGAPPISGSDSCEFFAAGAGQMWEGAADALAVLAGSDPVAIDLGCGDGHLLAALGARGVPGTGVERSPAVAALAAARGLDVRVGEAASADLPQASLIVALGEVLCRRGADGQAGLDAAIALAAARLRPGGALVFDALGDGFEAGGGSWREEPDRHVATGSLPQAGGLRRQTVAFHRQGTAWIRTADTWDLIAVAPSAVAAKLRTAGLIPTRVDRIGTATLQPGRHAWIARKPR